MSPTSFSMLGQFREGHIATVSDVLCTLTRMVNRQEAGLSLFCFIFSPFSVKVFAVAQLLLGLLCNGSVTRWWNLPESPPPPTSCPYIVSLPGDLSCQLLHTHGHVLS